MPDVQVTTEFLIASGLAAALFLALVRTWWTARKDRARYRGITSVDDEVARLRGECERLEGSRAALDKDFTDAKSAHEQQIADLQTQHAEAKSAHAKQIADLQTQYNGSRETYDRLSATIRELENDLECIDVGLYRPHFNFSDAESYKRAVLECRDDIKRAIKQDSAITWGAAWTVEGSSSKGERLQKQYGKLMLRAFNGECDAAIASVSWNNVTKLEARLEKDFEAINKLGTVMKAELNAYYLGLRLRELRLVHEHARKKQE